MAPSKSGRRRRAGAAVDKKLLDVFVFVFGNGENGENGELGFGAGPRRTEATVPQLNLFLSSAGGPRQAAIPTFNTAS
ncbi:hypothetical protein Sste5346_007367 [Sporothrix stenoceras]|uniref:Uncharacterized protein n=1 Tax=Sporothrix stenoceras TaxID=5173 RepID=A0ABR3YVG7_9PEZI